MHSRNELERLAAAGRPLLSRADSLVGRADEDRIFDRIVAADRHSPSPAHRGRRTAFALAGVAVLAAAGTLASLELGGGGRPAATGHRGPHRVALTGAKITLAGYRFRTPAGYAPSNSCPQPATSTPGSPNTVVHSMESAALTDGGCLDVAILGSWTIPAEAQPVSVGSYNGFLVVPANIPQETLFVQIPVAQGDVHYLVLAGQGLTEDQLIAIAESGLPASP